MPFLLFENSIFKEGKHVLILYFSFPFIIYEIQEQEEKYK
jgi:hypothetical protein